MPLIECGLCSQLQEVSMYEHWNCDDCGCDWGIRLLEYSKKELNEAFVFISQLRNSSVYELENEMVILAHELEDPENEGAESLVDTLLLFFDSLIIPDYTFKDLVRVFGDDKAEVYRNNNLIKCSDNSFVELLGFGVNPSKPYSSEYDFSLANPAFNKIIPCPNRSVIYSLYRVMEHIEYVYSKQLTDLLSKTNLFNKNRVDDTDQIILRGQQYRDAKLVKIIPMRFLRNEMFCHITGAGFIADTYYGIANTFREDFYTQSCQDNAAEFKLFNEWLKTTHLCRSKLSPEELFEFREKIGTLSPFVEQIQSELSVTITPRNKKDMLDGFASEMEKRIAHYKKVTDVGHEKKAIYLSGLLNTLGALLGGTVGAITGGIVGTTVSQLALAYDRKIPPQISFIANTLLDK
jgi:hypothetical protein